MLDMIPSGTHTIETTTVQAQELTTLTGQGWTLTIFKNVARALPCCGSYHVGRQRYVFEFYSKARRNAYADEFC